MQILLKLIILFILLIISLTLSYPIIDISSSKISKSYQYQYNFQINSTSQINNIFLSLSDNILQIDGNFSILKLFSTLHKTSYIYLCSKILIKLSNTIFYTKNKSADIQIQIIHQLQSDQNKNQSIPKYVIMTQLFLVTKFIKKVEVILQKSINLKELVQKKVIYVQNMLKIIENTQVLMHQYNQQQRVNEQNQNQNDNNQNIIFMIRKQFALISHQDLQKVKQNLIQISKNQQVSNQIQQNNNKMNNSKNVLKIKQLYEVKQFKQKNNNEL